MRTILSIVLFSGFLTAISAQQAPTAAPLTTVPRLVRLSNSFHPANGLAASPVEGVTLSIYREDHGGIPLWQETQNVTVDGEGRYSVLMGSTLTDGMPLELFTAGEPRWLGLQFNRTGEVEQARTLLTSVPYALKAVDADTLGGLPASSYLLNPAASGPGSSSAAAALASALPGVKTVKPHVSAGNPNYLGMFTNTTDLGNSALYQNGGKIGLNTINPADYLHVAFNDNSGAFTGYAVQNLGSTGYSGTLFYDQNGALGQFQGFNNSTHEYRINNIASGGSINFMLGSSSKFLVSNTGDIAIGTGNLGIGTSTALSRLTSVAKPAFTATGTVSTSGTTTVTGTGTKFLSEVGVGDRIQIPSGTGSIFTVSSVVSDTILTTTVAFGVTSGSAGILPSPFRVDTSSGATALRVTDQGNVQIGAISGDTNPIKLFVAVTNPLTGTSSSTPVSATSNSGEQYASLLVRDTTTHNTDVGPIIGFSSENGLNANITAGLRGAKENATANDVNGYLGFYTTGGGSTTFAERMRLSSGGNLGIGISAPVAAVHVATGDVYVSQAASGIILKSPDGTKCARISIDNTGALATTSITCQ